MSTPRRGELLAKSVTDYSKDESGEASVLGTTLYDWSYGESYLPDKELAAEAFNSDEVCALTLVYNPGAADEETRRSPSSAALTSRLSAARATSSMPMQS